MPVGMTPLTPGTNKKLSELLKASFQTWEKEAQSRNITKGKLSIDIYKSNFTLHGMSNGLLLDSRNERVKNDGFCKDT